MVKIILDKYYILTSDERQWILKKLSGKKVVHWSYYSKLDYLLQDYLSIVLRCSNAQSIQELILVHKNTLNHIKTLLEPLGYSIIIKNKGDNNE